MLQLMFFQNIAMIALYKTVCWVVERNKLRVRGAKNWNIQKREREQTRKSKGTKFL